MVEISTADSKTSAQYRCEKCPAHIQKLRRCKEPREDFHFEKGDDNMWPLYVSQGGASFGFCPGKATWSVEAMSMFQLLVTATETGVMLESGGLNTQPGWWIELISWFAPMYHDRRFANRAKSILDVTGGIQAKGKRSGHHK